MALLVYWFNLIFGVGKRGYAKLYFWNNKGVKRSRSDIVILPAGTKTLTLYRIPKTVSSMATRKAPRMCKLELVFWLNWKAHR